MKVMVSAGIWAREHPDEVTGIMSKTSETELSAEELRKYYRDDFFMHLVPDVTDMGIEALEIEKRFLKEHGFISNDFDVKSWIDPSFLNNALNESGIDRM
jgi:ABC-type nitrate/sulfonate/bicarbonate transport system substrate-binding protein